MSTRQYHHRMSGNSIAGLINLLHKKDTPALIRARGKSMSPFIKHGDILIITSIKEKAPIFGDVVAFLHAGPEKFIVHRIVGKSGEFLIVKGDNVFGRSDIISTSIIIGVVTEFKKKISRHQRIGLGSGKKIIALLSRLRILNIFLFFFYFLKNMLR